MSHSSDEHEPAPSALMERLAGAAVSLSPSEAKIVTCLLEHAGHVVGRGDLEQLLWPNGAVPGERSLDYVVQRLRGRIAELNICINTAHRRGFVIYTDDP